MIQLMRDLEWNRIAIMYEDSLYCKFCIKSLIEQAQHNLICVSKQFAISVSNDGDVSIDQINSFLNEIMLQSPIIGGVVLFASKEVANKVLFAVDNKGTAKVPLFILSESVGLKDDVFKLASGTMMPKTKGSIIVSPPFTEVTSFTEYWTSLMTNTSLLKEKVESNPWLHDVFVSVANCDPLSSSTCRGLTLGQIEANFPKQPVYVKYGILSAHTMAKASLQLYNRLCSEVSTDCLADFKNKFKPYMMVEEMKGLAVDFGTDFPTVPVEPLTSSNYQMIFGNQSEPVSGSDHEVYQVYNYRQDSTDIRSDVFILIKVWKVIISELNRVDVLLWHCSFICTHLK